MKREEVIVALTKVFREVFKDESLVLRDEMTAADVEKWDSLSHIIMISKVEEVFGIKFKLKELNKLRQVGDLISIVESKIQ